MSNERSGKKQRKLKNVFVNKHFQVKVVLVTTGIVLIQALISTGYFLFVGNQFINQTLPGLTSVAQIEEAVRFVFYQLLIAFAVVNIDCLIVAVVLSIYFSHKTAGPTFVIKRAINNILEGVEHQEIILRKGDEFHDLAERINSLFSGMKDRCSECGKSQESVDTEGGVDSKDP